MALPNPNMEFSTPLRKVQRVKALRNSAASPLTLPSSPLRKSAVGNKNQEIRSDDSLVLDEHERTDRRKSVAMQKKLANIAPVTTSPVVVNKIMEASQLKEHLQVCTKLFAENKISAKNAWELNIIDIMRQLIISEGNDNVLQVGGTSLDISAKVYSIRVDDVHSRGMKLAGSMAKTRPDEDNEDVSACEGDPVGQGAKKKTTKKNKKRKMTGGKKNVIDCDDKNICSDLPQLESVFFSTKEDFELSSINNLLTVKLPVNASTHEFDLLNTEKCWTTAPDELLCTKNKGLVYPELLNIMEQEEISLNLRTSSICRPFNHFEFGKWDPEDEENLLASEKMVPEEVVLDEDGLPIPELDGSIHDIFHNEPDENSMDELMDDNEENEEVQFQAQLQGNFEQVVDAIPEESRQENDYGYNVLLKTASGMIIDKIWAGPSHWKLKCLRPSMPRYSGSVVTNAPKNTKKCTKAPAKPVDFYNYTDPQLGRKLVIKRKPPQSSAEKVTLPMPDLFVTTYYKTMNQLTCKPGVECRRKETPAAGETEQPAADCEVQPYKYENPNDSHYCSQSLVEDMDTNEPIENSFEEGVATEPQHNFIGDNLIDAPEQVPTNPIAYALHAKKMDMKKLKAAVWKCLVVPEDQKGQPDEAAQEVIPTSFQNLYKRLPQFLTTDMTKELSCPLVFTALLHLCNEKNLLLTQPPSENCAGCTDFQISKAF